MQVISNGSVDSGVGVFWMFYSGVDTTKHPPAPPHQGPDAPGRRPRIGLALSQTGCAAMPFARALPASHSQI